MVHRKILCINIMRYLALRGLKKSDLATKAGVSISYRGHRVEGTPDNAKREHFKNRMMAVTAGGR